MQRNLLPTVSARRDRHQGKTYYVDAAGKRFPSVTSILNATKPQADREALARWRSQVGKTEASRISQTASRRGSQTHKQIRRYLLGQAVDCPETALPYWQSLQPVFQDIEEVRLVESTVFHDALGYAGRIDCVIRYRGILCICDWKTADQARGSVDRLYDGPLQLAAYCGAVNQTYEAEGVRLRHALAVVAIAHQPAEIFWFEPDDVLSYWEAWQARLGELPDTDR